jgi:phospholipid/cholesterol/gamma-HCH transport system substrate-binding protein
MTARRRAAGVGFLLVMAVFVALTVQVYQKRFDRSVIVTLRADRTGNQLQASSEVKARGVVVGMVRGVQATRDGAEIELALDPDQVGRLPKDVSALLVPKTLFGVRYVQLSIPRSSGTGPLAAGDVIAQDRSANAIELERVFDDLLPVLQAVQPQKLAATLTAVATALQGRGEQLGDTVGSAADYLAGFNPNLPQLDQDIRDLAQVSQLYGDIAPDLLDALTDATVPLGTVAEKRAELSALYREVTASSQDLTQFLRNNSDNLIRLSAAGRAPLELAARYSPSFPCTLRALTDLKPAMDRVLGAGTGEPGLHVQVSVTTSRGRYLPGADQPVYRANGGPRCYPSGVAPGAGIPAVAGVPAVAGGAGVPAAAGPVVAVAPGVDDALGPANSPQERELLATLLAPSLGVAPGEVPAWSSVLVGPLYRGTEVVLR